MIGTDYPFDMGVEDPIARLDTVPGLSLDERRLISGENARHLLGLVESS